MRLAPLLFLLAACRPSAPAIALHDSEAPQPLPSLPLPSPDPAARLRALCEVAERSLAPPAERTSENESLDLAVAAQLAKVVRPLLPTAGLRKEPPNVHYEHAVRGGRLVEASAEDMQSEEFSERTSFLFYFPTHGSPRFVPKDTVLATADFDGDGKAEPLTQRCTQKLLFARECTLTAWFPAGEVSFTRTLMRGLGIDIQEHEKRSFVRIAPADGVPIDLFTADEVTVVSFAPSGTTTTDGAAIYAREATPTKLRYGLTACEAKLSELDEARWLRRVQALGATDAEAPALASFLVARQKAAPAAPPRDPSEPFTTRAMLSKYAPLHNEDAPIWAALPQQATAHCAALPAAVRDAWSHEREAIVRRRADARVADILTPIDIAFGCVQREGTLAVVSWTEEAFFEPISTAELYLLRPSADAGVGGEELIATTRSQWFHGGHDVYDLALGPSADFDGDGEDETLIVGTEHEIGSGGSSRIAAIWKNGAVRPVPGKAFGHVVVGALDPTHAAVVFTSGLYADGDKGWPPKGVFAFGKDAFRPTPVPPAWVTATKSARGVP